MSGSNLERLIIFIYHQNKLKNCTQPLKGKAITVIFDPIQIQNNGSGVFGNISGKGKGDVSDVLHTAGNASKSIDLGVARKHTPAAK
jgi:hypothetical protein